METQIEIKETLARTVLINGKTQDEALEAVRQLYRKGDIVLDSGDFVDVEIVVKDEHLLN